MGLFSNIGTAVKNVITKVSAVNEKAKVINPIIKKTVIGIQLGGGAIVAGAVVAPLATALVVGTGAIVGAGVVAGSKTPLKTAVNIVSAPTLFPETIYGLSKAGSQSVSEKSFAPITDYAKANPVGTAITSAVIGGALAIVGGKAITTGANLLLLNENNKKIAESNKLISSAKDIPLNSVLVPDSPSNNSQLLTSKDTAAALPTSSSLVSNSPLTPQTKSLTATSSSIKHYHRKAVQHPQSQTMRVNIYNQSKILNSRVFRSY